MVMKENIDAALDAHAQWKKRLVDAVNAGKSEFDPAVVKKDDQCQFGKWLYSLPPGDKASDDFTKARQLHADFHKVAGEILQLALSGKKAEAQQKLEFGGEYSHITGKLVIALQTWRSKIK